MLGGVVRRGRGLVASPAAWGVVALVLAALAQLRLLGHWTDADVETLVNFDTLFPFHLWIDTLRDGYSLGGWTLPIAPFVFPDVPVAGLALATTGGHLTAAVWVYGVIQFALLLGGAAFCARAVGVSGRAAVPALALVGVGLLLLGGVQESDAARHAAVGAAGGRVAAATAGARASQLFQSQLHSGTFAVVLWAAGFGILLLRRSAEGKGQGAAMTGLLVTTALGTMGNLLFVAQFVVPFVVTCGLAAAGRAVRVRAAGGAAAAVVLAAVGGRRLLPLFVTYGSVEGQTTGTRQMEVLAAFARGWCDRLLAGDVFHVASAVWLTLAGVAVVALIVRGVRRSDPAGWVWAALGAVLLAGSGVASVAAVASGGAHNIRPLDEYYRYSVKYFHPLLYGPVFGLAVALGAAVAASRLRAAGAWAMAGVALVAAVLLLVSIPAPLRPFADYRPQVADLADELADTDGITVGLSETWSSRLITLYSRRGVRAYPVGDLNEPYLWLSNHEWFYGGGPNRRPPPAYSFLVYDDANKTGGPHRQTMEALFGPPAVVRQTGTRRIAVYNRPGDGNFRDRYVETVFPPTPAR